MNKEFILNENTKSLVFVKDTEPAQVYLNGTLVEGMSAIKDTKQGTTEVTYNSEYKKNLLNMAFEGNTEQRLLPTEYQQVEYIESTGIQYIDTGVTGKNTLSFYVKTNSGAKTLFGAEDTTDTNKCMALAGNTWEGNDTDYIRYLTTNGIPLAVKLSSYDNYVLEISNTKATVYYDKQSKTISLTPTDNTVNYTIYLFARNKDGIASSFSDRKIYLFKIYESDVLIRDFIPCYRKADNVIGLYDLVNNVFYTNQGTGTFVKGANATPTVETPMDIVNSTNVSAELSGVNLFDYEDITYTYSNVYSQLRKTNFKVKPNFKYTIRFDYIVEQTDWTKIQFAIGQGDTQSYFSDIAYGVNLPNLTKGTFVYTFTTKSTENYPYLHFRVRRGAGTGTCTMTISNLMVVEGTQSLPYQPYFEPTKVDIPLTLRGIGDRKDNFSIDYINKKAIVKRNVFESDLLDLEWSLIKSTNNNTYFQANINKSFTSTGGYCNRCKVIQGNVTNENLADGEFKVYFINEGFYKGFINLVFASNFDLKKDTNSKLGDLNKLNQWLTNNPTNIALALLFNDTEEYKEEQWVKDLLALPTQNATNIINISADVPVSKLNVDYAIWGGRNESIS